MQGAGGRACAAGLLPEGGDGAGEGEVEGDVEAADVDAELEGVGGGDAAEVAAVQRRLDRAPLRRRVP